MNQQNVEAAVAVLGKTARGQQSLADLLALFKNGALGLDREGSAALGLLITAGLGMIPATVMEAIEAGLPQPEPPLDIDEWERTKPVGTIYTRGRYIRLKGGTRRPITVRLAKLIAERRRKIFA